MTSRTLYTLMSIPERCTRRTGFTFLCYWVVKWSAFRTLAGEVCMVPSTRRIAWFTFSSVGVEEWVSWVTYTPGVAFIKNKTLRTTLTFLSIDVPMVISRTKLTFLSCCVPMLTSSTSNTSLITRQYRFIIRTLTVPCLFVQHESDRTSHTGQSIWVPSSRTITFDALSLRSGVGEVSRADTSIFIIGVFNVVGWTFVTTTCTVKYFWDWRCCVVR